MVRAKLVLDTGVTMYENTKKFIFFAPSALIGLLITALLCGKYAPNYLLLHGHYALVNVWVFVLYLMLIIGCCVICPYFVGLVLIGIGQIAVNTCTQAEMPPAAIPSIHSAPFPTQRADWECEYCGKKNPSDAAYCISCHYERS